MNSLQTCKTKSVISNIITEMLYYLIILNQKNAKMEKCHQSSEFQIVVQFLAVGFEAVSLVVEAQLHCALLTLRVTVA